jgi:hypothetical protein
MRQRARQSHGRLSSCKPPALAGGIQREGRPPRESCTTGAPVGVRPRRACDSHTSSAPSCRFVGRAGFPTEHPMHLDRPPARSSAERHRFTGDIFPPRSAEQSKAPTTWRQNSSQGTFAGEDTPGIHRIPAAGRTRPPAWTLRNSTAACAASVLSAAFTPQPAVET